MTKPKNPYFAESSEWFMYEDAYSAGLRDGEKRLERALRRWIKSQQSTRFYAKETYVGSRDVLAWLSSRQKKERKK